MQRLGKTFIFALAWAMALQSPPVRADDSAMEQWRSNKEHQESYVRNMKPLGKNRISDVIELGVEKRFLVLRTPLYNLAAEESLRANFIGIPGTAIVAVLREDHGTQPVEPTRFNLAITDFSVPGASVQMTATRLSQPTPLLALTKTIQANGRTRNVVFNQQGGPASSGQGTVQLIVAEYRSPTSAPTQFTLESADFLSFVRDHPAETSRYVRPLLRDLMQERVFAPDEMIASQVFGDLWKSEPEATRHVQDLLPALDSADYHVRDSALKRLGQMGREGALVLLHLDRSRLSAEQNSRIDRALFPYVQLSIKEVARLRSDPGFLLDCLYSTNPSLAKAALERLRVISQPELRFDLNAAGEERSLAINTLRAQLTPPSPGSGDSLSD